MGGGAGGQDRALLPPGHRPGPGQGRLDHPPQDRLRALVRLLQGLAEAAGHDDHARRRLLSDGGTVGLRRRALGAPQQPGQTSAWVSTLDGTIPRGVPYYNTERKLPCVLNHGLWTSVPDFDAPTQLLHARYPRELSWTDRTIPVGTYFPMCGMNVAIRPQAIPAFYFLLMGRGYDYDRFGDIWSGVILKRSPITSAIASTAAVRPSSTCAPPASGRTCARRRRALSSTRPSGRRSIGSADRLQLPAVLPRDRERLRLARRYWENLRKAMVTWTELFPDEVGAPLRPGDFLDGR